MLVMSVKQFHELTKLRGGVPSFIPLRIGFNVVRCMGYGELIYICPLISLDRKECLKCKDRFICFTNKWGVSVNG